MHKVLVVDDEMIFRKGLRHLIQGFDLNWEVCGEARDGMEALEMIREQRPDLVITDIRMPRMDGIQLQAAVAEQYPDIRCVVLSGYNDFEYARSSIRSGARDYLLKPVQKDELYAALNRIEGELDTREAVRPISRPSEQLMRQQLLSGIVHGRIAYDAAELLEEAGLSFDGKKVYCLIAQLDRSSVAEQRYHQTDPELFLLYIQQFVREVILTDWHGYTFMEQQRVVTLIQTEHDEDAEVRIRQQAGQLVRTIKRMSQLTITVGIGRGAVDLESVPRSYREAEVALLYRLTTGGDRVLIYPSQPIAGQSDHPVRLPAADRHFLEQLLSQADGGQLNRQVQEFIDRLCRQISQPQIVQQQVSRIMMECYEIALDYGIVDSWLQGRDIGQTLQEVWMINDRQELADYCSSQLQALYELIRHREGHVTHAVDQVVQYMEEHYAEPITLGLMAEKVYLNASYLSSLFKARLGKSFIEVLTEIRIREAIRRLVHTDEKISGIAVETGFVNIRHFNRVFKAETQMTPKQYREHRRSLSNPV
ncbi:response regulator [Paenibacillus sp. Z6-24]